MSEARDAQRVPEYGVCDGAAVVRQSQAILKETRIRRHDILIDQCRLVVHIDHAYC
jgi:hypothetical protein